MTDIKLDNLEKLATNNDLLLSDNLINFTKEITIEKNTIHVEKKNIYGNELLYPVCQRAKIFAVLTGQKTLSAGAISSIKRLGFSVREYINREL
jgi:hypothetical protein